MVRNTAWLSVQLCLLCAWIPSCVAFSTSGPVFKASITACPLLQMTATCHTSTHTSLHVRCSMAEGSNDNGGRSGALSRREGLSILTGAALAAVTCPQVANALCGGKPASWEFWVPWEEDLVPFKSAQPLGSDKARGVYYRVVGNKGKERTKIKGKEYVRRPLLIISDKFQSHDYLQTLEAVVTSDRRVVEYDALGAGLSEPLPAAAASSLKADNAAAVSYAVEELIALSLPLQKTMKVDGYHVFGHGFGALVAAELVKKGPDGLVSSLTLAAPPKSMTPPTPSPSLRVLYVKDPVGLCTVEASDSEREVFVKNVIEFLDEVDGCPTTERLFT